MSFGVWHIMQEYVFAILEVVQFLPYREIRWRRAWELYFVLSKLMKNPLVPMTDILILTCSTHGKFQYLWDLPVGRISQFFDAKFHVRTVIKCKVSLFHWMFSDASGVSDWCDPRGVSSAKSICIVSLKTWNLMDIKVDGQKSHRVSP